MTFIFLYQTQLRPESLRALGDMVGEQLTIHMCNRMVDSQLCVQGAIVDIFRLFELPSLCGWLFFGISFSFGGWLGRARVGEILYERLSGLVCFGVAHDC